MSDKSAIIKEAQRYLARGQVDKAIVEWEKLAKEFPDGATLNTIGDLYLKKGSKPEAIDSFHKAATFFRQEGFSLKSLALYKKILNINPSDPDALFSLGELNEAKGLITDAMKYYLASADMLSKEGKKDRILGIYEKIVSLSPSNIPLRSKIADIYIKEGLVQEAVKQYVQIARLHAEKGDTEKAVSSYRRVLDAEPLNKETILELSGLYEKEGDLAQSMALLKEAVGLFPNDAEIVLRCAEVHIAAERLDEAKEYLRQVAGIEPANIKARRLLGNIYVREGQRERAWAEYLPILDEMLLEENYDEAIGLLESFKSIDPIETRKRLVTLHMQLGEQPRVMKELVELGEAFVGQEREQEALNCYKEALKMSPDDAGLREKVVELEKALSMDHVPVEEEKTSAEAVTEADIYLRYGLYENARDLLETFRERDPENIDIHLRLRSLHVETGDKDQAVAESLVLRDLYQKAGDTASSDQIMREAIEISPEDPRLAGEVLAPAEEEAGAPPGSPVVEDYSEEIAEADFYLRQGLLEEARAILERLNHLFPENTEINQKLSSIGQLVEGVEKKEEAETPVLEESEALPSEEIAEPALDNDVMDIFNEFKKGLEKELEEEDFETHYNLGIAYKEMGLLDDAIREFQASRKDPRRFIHSSNMLGVCYVEKGLYPLAIEVLKDALGKMGDRDESYWAMKYELAEACEKNGGLKEALELYIEVFGWNSKFRNVSDKIEHLKSSIVDSAEQKKPKDRKDRVSYL